MKRFHRVALVAALLVAPAALAAQDPDGRVRLPPRERLAPVERLLEQREALALAAEQVTALEQIRARLREREQPLLEQLESYRTQLRQGGPPRAEAPEQREALREQLRSRRDSLRPVMEQLRESRRTAMQEIREVLTDEQETRMRATLREHARADRDRPNVDRRERRFRGQHRGH